MRWGIPKVFRELVQSESDTSDNSFMLESTGSSRELELAHGEDSVRRILKQ